MQTTGRGRALPLGPLDFLDNNVGIGSRGSVVDEKPEQYSRAMQVNVETMFLLSKHAIPP